MASSSLNRLDYALQNLIAKSVVQFPMWAPNKASLSPTKKQWCVTGQETVLDNSGCQEFQTKQSFQSYTMLPWFLENVNIVVN
jgi:hypothetical protein